MTRVFASPGTIYEPEGTRPDYWRMARAIYAAGFRARRADPQQLQLPLCACGLDDGNRRPRAGLHRVPGGTGQTEQQVHAMAELQPAGYIGTPSFLKMIIEKAAELGVTLPSVTKALVSGEAFPPSLRDWFAQQGIAGYQCYATGRPGPDCL